jgi:chromosome segregation ATPase
MSSWSSKDSRRWTLWWPARRISQQKPLLKGLEEENFVDEIAGTLGAYATANQYSVGTLRSRLKHKDRLINKLQSRLSESEMNARNEAYKELKQAREVNRQEIEKLKTNLEQMQQSIEEIQTQAEQQEGLINQLQTELDLAESQVIDMTIFQT